MPPPTHPRPTSSHRPHASRYLHCVAITIVACGNISVIHLSVTSPSRAEHEGVTPESAIGRAEEDEVTMGRPVKLRASGES